LYWHVLKKREVKVQQSGSDDDVASGIASEICANGKRQNRIARGVPEGLGRGRGRKGRRGEALSFDVVVDVSRIYQRIAACAFQPIGEGKQVLAVLVLKTGQRSNRQAVVGGEDAAHFPPSQQRGRDAGRLWAGHLPRRAKREGSAYVVVGNCLRQSQVVPVQ